MKKITLLTLCAIATIMFTSCGKNDYKAFIGTWGVESIDYYNIDYAGNPIASSMVTYCFIPGDPDDGIDLVFREDKTGEMRDRTQDTIYKKISSDPLIIDTIICPDTILVTKFTYSFDKSADILYMNMQGENYVHTYKMNIIELKSNSFVYENEYGKDYVEKAYMQRLSNETAKSANRNGRQSRPYREGSFLSGR